jgi:hypothetical protein
LIEPNPTTKPEAGAHARRNDVRGAKALQAIRIGHDEVVAVWHLHLRQRFRIHRIAVADAPILDDIVL